MGVARCAPTSCYRVVDVQYTVPLYLLYRKLGRCFLIVASPDWVCLEMFLVTHTLCWNHDYVVWSVFPWTHKNC